MVLVLGDNFEFVLAIFLSGHTGQNRFTTESTVVEAVGRLRTAIELGYEIFVRARLIIFQLLQ